MSKPILVENDDMTTELPNDTDANRAKIPKQLVWAVIAISISPFLLSLLGVDFGRKESPSPLPFCFLRRLISAESEVGVGTMFHIYLPASEKQVRSQYQREEKIIPGSGRILVMDDQQLIRDLSNRNSK